MTIPESAQNHPIVAPSVGLPLVNHSNGMATNNARLALQQLHNYVVNMNRTMPCNASMTLNVLTLTLLEVQPQVDQYVSYESFRFVAPADSTGTLTAKVVSASGTLATLNVYLASTAAAGAGALVQDALYELTFNDALNAGAGGLILSLIGGSASAITTLTDSSGGVASDTIAAVSGTGDDTDINNNFASLAAKVDAILSAIGAA